MIMKNKHIFELTLTVVKQQNESSYEGFFFFSLFLVGCVFCFCSERRQCLTGRAEEQEEEEAQG